MSRSSKQEYYLKRNEELRRALLKIRKMMNDGSVIAVFIDELSLESGWVGEG